MKLLNICMIIYNTFFQLSLTKKQRNMIEIAIMYFLNICFNGRHIGTSQSSTLRDLFNDKIRYLIRNTTMIFKILILYYQKSMITFIVFLSKLTRQTLYLIVDDTFVEKDKRSSNIIKGGKKGYKEGFSFLTMVIALGNIDIPLLVKPCYRKVISEQLGVLYLSKIDKAEYYIRLFYNLGLDKVKTIVLLDSWYTSNRILKLISQELPNMGIVGALKCNRHLSKKRIDEYNFTNISGNEIKDHYLYELGVRTGNLNGLHKEFSVLISRRTNMFDKKYSIRYIICSELDFTAIEILHHYQNRWRIEVFHRIFKYRFCPEKWRFYGIDKYSDSKQEKSISITSVSNLCCLCLMSLGFAVRYTVKSLGIKHLVKYKIGENFISYSLSYIKPVIILENEKYKMFRGKL